MGLLNDMLGKIVGGTGGGSEANIMNAVAGMLGNQGTGGLAGLVESFKKNGLGDVVSSWVGTGANLPVTPQEIMKGLGKDQVSQLASKVGLSPEALSSSLSKMLPDVVDKLTPTGKMPTDDLLQQGLNMLKRKF